MSSGSGSTCAATALAAMIAQHKEGHLDMKLKYDDLMAQHQKELESFEKQLALEAMKQAASPVSESMGTGGISLLEGLASPQPIESFLDLITEEPVPLRAFGEKFFVPPKALSASAFFQAKMERWGDEELAIPTGVTREALGFLVRRLHVGCPVPVKQFNLSVQVLALAKLWLFDDIADEIVASVMARSLPMHLGTLERLSKRFDLPILKERAELLRKKHIGKDELVAMIKSMAEYEGGRSLRSSLFQNGMGSYQIMPDDERSKLYEAVLLSHPDKDQALLDAFIQLPPEECALVSTHNPCDLVITSTFFRLLEQLIAHGVMNKSLENVLNAFLSKIHTLTEFKHPRGHLLELRMSRELWYADKEWCLEHYALMLKEATHQLRSGALPVQILKMIVEKSDVWISERIVDESLEELVTGCSVHLGKQICNVLASSLPVLPPRTAQALQQAATYK